VRPWAAECVVGPGWSFEASSWLLFALPWATLAGLPWLGATTVIVLLDL
jgi:hypothetical protein